MTQMECKNELSFFGPNTTDLEREHMVGSTWQWRGDSSAVISERTLEETYAVYPCLPVQRMAGGEQEVSKVLWSPMQPQPKLQHILIFQIVYFERFSSQFNLLNVYFVARETNAKEQKA